jgi:hypothetical protein
MEPNMKEAMIYYKDRKYFVRLDVHGAPVAYYVEVSTRGKRTSKRLLWSAERHGWVNGGVPQGLKDVLNVRGASEQIAYAMGW